MTTSEALLKRDLKASIAANNVLGATLETVVKIILRRPPQEDSDLLRELRAVLGIHIHTIDRRYLDTGFKGVDGLPSTTTYHEIMEKVSRDYYGDNTASS